MKRGVTIVLALLLLGACTRKKAASPKPTARAPDLAAANSGGARTLAAVKGFRYIPGDAVVVGVAEPGLILGAPAWRARVTGLVQAVQALRSGGYDPARTRFLFFGVVGGQDRLATAVVADGRLSGVPGARREKVGDIEVQRFDGAATGLAWAPGLTLVGREPALERALGAGRRAAGTAPTNAAFQQFQQLFDRLPARAPLRMVALMRPALIRLASEVAARAPASLAALLGVAPWVSALGFAIYELGPDFRLALVLRVRDPSRAPVVAARAGRAFSALRLPPGQVSREPLPSLAEAALAGMRIRHRGEYVFAETAVPTDLVVSILSR